MIQQISLAAVCLGLFAAEIWALADAIRRPSAAFLAAGRTSKATWILVLALAALIGLVALPPPIGPGSGISIFALLAVIVAAIYLAIVRPQLGGGRRHYGSSGTW